MSERRGKGARVKTKLVEVKLNMRPTCKGKALIEGESDVVSCYTVFCILTKVTRD